MTAKHAKQLVFFLDGLKFSFRMADVISPRLRATLDTVAERMQQHQDYEELVASALLDVWSLVDICHRIRELVQQVPRLPQKSPELQVFLRATSDIESLRHYMQHLRTGIADIPLMSYPVWGALSWVPSQQPNAVLSLCSGTLHGVNAPTISYDWVERRFTSKLLLFAGDVSVRLDDIFQRLRDLELFLIQWIDANFNRTQGPTLITMCTIKADRPDDSS